MTVIVSLVAVFALGGLSFWNLCSKWLQDRKDRKQRRVSTAIHLLPWLYEVGSRHQHLSWEITRGLDIDLLLRNPWQFQEAFRLPDLTDANALQYLWTLFPTSFSQVTQLLLAVSSYNALVDSAPLCQQREDASHSGRYGAEIPLRLRAIGQCLTSAIGEIKKILASNGLDLGPTVPGQNKVAQQPQAICPAEASGIQT
ncbi:MAG TPA: hypothetical protein VHZ32_00595 [Rhizomicrobium sp.]|jgi:hypothetical protein|nr:hypothetical protein [Rhizomicrobium sp.]